MQPSNLLRKFQERGQSLVELALILPILILLVAGIVEVSNLLITKNRIETAARAAARFAARGGEEIENVVLNTVTETLDLSEGVWDIWLIEAQLDENNPNNFAGWNADADSSDSITNTTIYGIGNTTAYTEVQQIIGNDCVRNPNPIDLNNPEANHCIRDQVLAFLVNNRPDDAANWDNSLGIKGVYIVHDIDSILGLNALPAFADVMSVKGLGIMRFSNITSQATNGCATAFPIAVDRGVRSLSSTSFPAGTEFQYPSPAPTYANFFNNEEDKELDLAKEGYIYLFSRSSLRLVWPKWNSGIAGGSLTLANSLAWPGNLWDYADNGDSGQPFSPPGHVIRGFVEVGDDSDRALHIEDRVSVNLSASILDSNVMTELNDHIDNERGLRFVVLPINGGQEQYLPAPDGRPYYKVDGFAIFRIHGYASNGDWILAEFVKWDNSCGQN